jgi:hypothetical protein
MRRFARKNWAIGIRSIVNSGAGAFRRFWDVLLDALVDSAPKTVQMIDSTVIPAHHQAANAKGGISIIQQAALRWTAGSPAIGFKALSACLQSPRRQSSVAAGFRIRHRPLSLRVGNR